MKQPYLAKLRFLLFLLLGLATSWGTAWAQAGGGTVTGRVTDTKNEGIPGVTVVIEGTTLGSSTDIEGNYSISNVPAGPHTVVISFVGYTTVRQPVTVTAGKTAAVAAQQLAENATALGEAVVVGYGTQRRQDVTGSLTTVSDKDFVKGQITTPTQLVQGKIAGVQITDGGGAPGAATTIRIRGGSSLNANNDPLIVIDGVPVDNPPTTGIGALAGVANPLSLINPNDIESFTVLKDASATAIYGSRASNGVILITTKKGLSGEALTVNVSSQTSISRRYNSLPVLSADEFRTQVQRLAPTKTNLLGTANTNWQDEIFRTAATYDNNVSITGSLGKKVPYRVSYGNLIQQGTLITNKLVRNSGSISLTPVILDDHLRINLNVKGSVSDNNFADNGAIGAAAAFNPTLPVYSGNAAYGGYYEYLQSPTNPNSAPQQNVPANPVAQLMLTRDRSTVLRSIGNVQLDYKVHFLPDLHANLNVGYDVLRSEGTKNQSVQLASTYFNTPRVVDPTTANARSGSYTLYKQNRDNKLLEFYLNYSKQIGDHRIEALAGYSYQDFVTTSPAYASYLGQDGNYDINGLPRLIERTAAARNPYDTRYRIYSFYGRLNYNFKDRYLLTGTLRNDNSSRFPGQHPLFPAASIAWRVKGEDFLKGNTTISDLKLRLSYGRTGQQDVFGVAGDYPTIPRYTLNAPNAQYQLGGIPYQPYSPLGYNSSLRWETTDTYNAGVDLGFLDGRITASVDAYYRKTVDLLNGIFLPGLTNFTNYYVFNVGSLENRGVEVNVNINPVRTTNFRWDINLNGTYNKNKITSLGPQQEGFVGIETNGVSGGTGTNIGIFAVGQSSTAFYAAKQVYDTNGKPLDGVFADLNGDGKVDASDRYIYKQSAPPVILGFSSNMSYKKLSLAFTLRSNIGNYVYNNIQAGNGTYYGILGSTSFLSNLTSDALFTEIPNANAANHYSSDYYIQNASFVRMQNATLGYNVGKIFRDRGNLNLSFAVQNVFVITKYTGLDPEISNGVDNNTYPRPRVFTFGLNLNI